MIDHPISGLLGIGDNVVDLYQERGEFFPGGNALNVAVLARRFGLAATGYIGLIGNDREGEHVRRAILAEGLSDERLRQAKGPNGRAIVTLDADGDRVFVGSNKGGIRRQLTLRMDDEDLEWIDRFGHVHTSCFSYIEAELPGIRARARALSFDFSTWRESDYIARVAPHVTMAFFSGSDLGRPQIAQLVARVHGYGVGTVGITRGEKGAVLSTGGRLYEQGIKPTRVVDTMGAGDAFIAGYLAATIHGRGTENALDFAATCAAEACTWHGAFGHPCPDMPARPASPHPLSPAKGVA
jgi:fructoselysine 6-kinase